MGILHGGASVTLAESIGSVGSNILIDTETEYAVGLSINANHIGSAKTVLSRKINHYLFFLMIITVNLHIEINRSYLSLIQYSKHE